MKHAANQAKNVNHEVEPRPRRNCIIQKTAVNKKNTLIEKKEQHPVGHYTMEHSKTIASKCDAQYTEITNHLGVKELQCDSIEFLTNTNNSPQNYV